MQASHIPVRLTNELSPVQVGAEMARLRAQFGLSQQQVSERLHIRARYIAAIEEGKFETLPGKVYARGYVQTYAEFLGLDAEHTVNLCFASEGAVSSITQHRPPPSLSKPVVQKAASYRVPIIALAMVIFVGLGVQQFSGQEVTPENEDTALIEAQPEEILAEMRTLVMPTPHNKECLMTNQWLACARADSVTATLGDLDAHRFYVTGDIDVSDVELEAPAEESPTEGEDAEKPADEKPAEEVPTEEPATEPSPEPKHD